MDIKLVVGLGNPGRQYEDTRHNVGFMILDKLADTARAEFAQHLKWRAEVAKIPGAMLMKPLTFMNNSGQSIGAALRFYKWKPEQVLIVYDDVAIPFGQLRFRNGGSAGGHNGMKSAIQHLGTDQFPRLKVGIGGPQPGKMVGHVLGKFKPEEKESLQMRLASAAEAVQLALSQGVSAAANVHNSKSNQ